MDAAKMFVKWVWVSSRPAGSVGGARARNTRNIAASPSTDGDVCRLGCVLVRRQPYNHSLSINLRSSVAAFLRTGMGVASHTATSIATARMAAMESGRMAGMRAANIIGISPSTTCHVVHDVFRGWGCVAESIA